MRKLNHLWVILNYQNSILATFLTTLKTQTDPNAAAKTVTNAIKNVWEHHFSSRVIHGRENTETEEDNSKKMIVADGKIKEKILDIWKKWKELLRNSMREDRASKPSFKDKEAKFVSEVLEMPLNILKKDYVTVLEKSGIRDWKEDLQHLHNQLAKDQIGCCESIDTKQEKRDRRKEVEKCREISSREKAAQSQSFNVADDSEDFTLEENASQSLATENDPDFFAAEKDNATKKIDVMCKISHTADR